jgi:hypothetical protein
MFFREISRTEMSGMGVVVTTPFFSNYTLIVFEEINRMKVSGMGVERV